MPSIPATARHPPSLPRCQLPDPGNHPQSRTMFNKKRVPHASTNSSYGLLVKKTLVILRCELSAEAPWRKLQVVPALGLDECHDTVITIRCGGTPTCSQDDYSPSNSHTGIDCSVDYSFIHSFASSSLSFRFSLHTHQHLGVYIAFLTGLNYSVYCVEHSLKSS